MDQHIKLHDYQVVAKDFLINHPKAGLFLDVGFGKTLTTLVALQELGMTGRLQGHILIVAPKAIARSTWLDEMEKWNIRANTVSLIVNAKGKQLTRKKRIALYETIESTPPSFYFINQELLKDLIDWHQNSKRRWPFPTVVVDELQGFKSYSSARFKALRSVFYDIERFVGLTGTPTPQGLMDLWAEICLMDDGYRLGNTVTEYRNTFFNPGLVINNNVVQWIPKYGAEPYIYNLIRDLVISVKNPNLKLPPVTYNNFTVYMSDEEEEIYKQFVKDKVLSIAVKTETADDDADTDANNGEEAVEEKEVNAANAAVLTAKLSQLASGTIYTEKGSKNYAVFHQHKLEALEYIINNTTSPVLVAYHFQSDKDQIVKYLTEKGILCKVLDGSPEMQKEWNEGKIPVMLLQPASAGHGINIQFGGHTLVWYTVSWSLENYIQTNGRLVRQGQKDPVVIHHLMTAKTIDSRILKTIERKDASEQALLEAVAATIEEATN